MADRDWLTAQMVNKLSTEQLWGISTALSTTIAAKGTTVITVAVAGAVAGDPCTASPNKSLGNSISLWSRSIDGGVEVRLFNESATLPATLSGVVFKAVIFKEVS